MSLQLPRKRIPLYKETTQKKKKILPQPAQPHLVGLNAMKCPTMMLVGNSLGVNEVAKTLTKLGVTVKKMSYIKDVKKYADGSEDGLIYVAPLRKGDMISIHNNLRKSGRFRKIPCFAVVPEWVNSRRERQMYKSGIRMVFEWPKEKKAFAHLMSGILLTGTAPVRADDADEALEAAVANRLVARYGSFSPSLQTIAYNGIVMLRGKVRSRWRKNTIVNQIKKMPGVRGVVDSALKIKNPNLGPKQMEKVARRLIEKIAPEMATTLQVNCSEQTLSLQGTAKSSKDLDRIQENLEKLEGIKKVKRNVVISANRFNKDKFLAKRVKRVLKKVPLAKTNGLQVKVVGGKAILRGSVGSPLEAEHLAKQVATLSGITSVKNELNIVETIS